MDKHQEDTLGWETTVTVSLVLWTYTVLPPEIAELVVGVLTK